MAGDNGAAARQRQVRQDGSAAAILDQAAALAAGSGCLVAQQGPLDWKFWSGKGGQAESLRVPSPAALLEGGGPVELHLGNHRQEQSRGVKL